MWFECLPSIGIVAACLYIGPLGCLVVNYLFLNKHKCGKHWQENAQDFHLYRRDTRITGSEYIPLGLEGIPPKTQ